MNRHRIEIALLIAAVFPVMVSFAVSWHTGQGHWFSRAGFLTVLFTAIIEFRRARQATDEIGTAILHSGLGIPLAVTPSRAETAIHICAVVTLVLGTVIWGYGDLLF